MMCMKMKHYIFKAFVIMIISFLICNLIWLLHDVYKDPISKYHAQEKLVAYLERKYPEYETTYELEKITYNYKKRSYTIRCVNKAQPLFYFDVMLDYKDNIYDTYQENILEGSVAWTAYVNQQYQAIEEAQRQECERSFGYCYSSYDMIGINEKTKEDFFRNQNMDSLNVLTINGNRINDLSASSIADAFRELKAIFEKSNVLIRSYSIDFMDETGSKGINIYNVSGEIIDRNDFETLMAQVKESNDQFIDLYGFYALGVEVTIEEE